MKNETGEFELVLGNRQLLSGFAVVVILFGVFFAMGYIVGRSAAPSTRVAAGGEPAPMPSPMPAAAEARPQASLGLQTPPAVSPAPASDTSADPAAAPQTLTQPARDAAAATPAEPASPPPAPPAEADAAQTYLQVMAVKRPEAEVVVRSLKDKGFPALLAPSPKEGMFRVLVGPYKDASSLGKAKADLENSGFHPFVQK